MQLLTDSSVVMAAVKHLTLTVTLDDANIDQALFGPPPFIEISQRYLHLMEETTECRTVYVCCNFGL